MTDTRPIDRLAGAVLPVTPFPEGSWSARLGWAQVVFGPGALEGLGDLARGLGGRRALLVTDPGVQAAGHAGRAAASLRAAGLDVETFTGVEENPGTRHVEEGTRSARRFGPDLLVGLGGGSALDTAKGINFLLTNGGTMEDYWGTDRATLPMLASVGIPTTAGTGSEAQSYALIEQEGTRRKMACGDIKARFRAVILDPTLTATVPPAVAALAALDALSHAVESHVSRAANPVSRLYSREAWRLLEAHLDTVLRDPRHEKGRAALLLGAHLAGAAVEASMLGAAHACANPLTSRFDVAHGAAVNLTLPHVVRFNEVDPAAAAGYATLREEIPAGRRPAELADRLTALRDVAGLPRTLADVGIPAAALDDLSQEAARQWTAAFNPRPVGVAELRSFYDAAL